MTDYVTGRDEVNLQSILIGSWTDEMGLSHLLGTASFVPQENINLLTVCWSMTWWLNIFVLMDFDTKHTDNKIWPIFRISEILTKTQKRSKQSRVEELESHQRSCTRQKVLVRQQHGGLMRQLARWDMMMTRHDDSRWWCAMELNVSEEITCNRQNHSFLSNKYTSQALYQTLQTTKWTYWKAARQYNLKFAKTLLQSGFNLLHVWSPAVPKFVFAVLFVYLLFTFWAVLFMFYTHFCGSFPLFQFDKFPKHTELL